jgi:hypothetical protein
VREFESMEDRRFTHKFTVAGGGASVLVLFSISHRPFCQIFLSGLQNGEETSQEVNSCQKEREPNRPNDTKVICHTDR